MGHTLSIHSQNQDIIMKFALEKPAHRVIVNSSATHGAVGFSSGLDPAMTLGCGAYGGNITSDNLTPMHLINVKRLAFELRPADLQKTLADYGYPSAAESPRVGSHVVASVEQRVSDFLDRRGFSSHRSDATSDVVSSKTKAANVARGEAAAGSERPTVIEPSPLDFISEEDVRVAIEQGRKLAVGPETVVTPSARDLGNENGVFIRN
jgi:acetaldehyde dehydrogenase (acetylating)